MMTLPPRELVGYALCAWDARVSADERTEAAFLGLAGMIISHSPATLDDTWPILQMITAWDKVTSRKRHRADYLAMADRILAQL
ncbi:hypothetical protein [Streptomyces sp. ADI96-02]|uniref:hypothetical protein n=1 Tax=Streptomyces sp. ADI96-02 TaxID=1522760 RepID=UPI000F55359C|nr:hypothetical protein [Streptomyces sp. ADI96-02]